MKAKCLGGTTKASFKDLEKRERHVVRGRMPFIGAFSRTEALQHERGAADSADHEGAQQKIDP